MVLMKRKKTICIFVSYVWFFLLTTIGQERTIRNAWLMGENLQLRAYVPYCGFKASPGPGIWPCGQILVLSSPYWIWPEVLFPEAESESEVAEGSELLLFIVGCRPDEFNSTIFFFFFPEIISIIFFKWGIMLHGSIDQWEVNGFYEIKCFVCWP